MIQKQHILKISLYLLILAACVQAQSLEQTRMAMVKANPDYVWGEGTGRGQDIARRDAEEDLLSKIQISIAVKTELVMQEKSTQEGSTLSEEFQYEHASFSNLYLKGLDRIEYRRRRTWAVLAYIHRDSLAASFELRKAKILGFAQAGWGAAEKGRVGEALRNYYWGYLLARTYPDAIEIGKGLPANPQVAMTSRVNSAFEDIKITAEECYMDGDAVMVPLEFSFHGQPISELHFNYYSGMGTDYAIVEDGWADIPIYDQPTSKARKLTLGIEYQYANEMASDPEIEALYSVFGGHTAFDHLKSVGITFPWVDSPGKPPPTAERETNTEALDVLNSRRDNVSEFLELLGQYRKLGFLKYGKRNDFGDGAGCYVAVADQQKVVDILYYNGRTFTRMDSRESFTDLADHFKGKFQIWIQETR